MAVHNTFSVYFIIGAGLLYSLLYHVQIANCAIRVDRAFDYIRTTAPLNTASNTYEIPENTTFNVTCGYTDVPVASYAAAVRWKVESKGVPARYLFRDGSYEDRIEGAIVSPLEVPQSDSLQSGVLTLTESKMRSEFYSPDSIIITYSCELVTFDGDDIDNPALTETFYIFAINISVVGPATKITALTPQITVDKSSDVLLTCESDGLPSAEITWTRVDGKPLYGSNSLNYTHKSFDGILKLFEVTHLSAAVYSCSTLSATRTELSAVTSLTVNHVPILSQLVRKRTGDLAELQCLVSKASQGVVWYHTDSTFPLRYGVTYSSEISADTSLNIAKILNDDSRFTISQRMGDEENSIITTLTIHAIEVADYDRLYCCTPGTSELCYMIKEKA